MQRQLHRLVETAAEEAEGWARKLKSLGDDEKAMQVRNNPVMMSQIGPPP
jgi:hypothetical protein